MASTLSLGGRPGMAAFVEKPRKPRTESQKQMSMVDAQMRQVESGLEKLRACYWTPSPPCIVEHRNAWRCAQSSGASPLSIPVPSASVLPSCQAILVQANRDGKHIESGSLGSTLGRNPSFGSSYGELLTALGYASFSTTISNIDLSSSSNNAKVDMHQDATACPPVYNTLPNYGLSATHNTEHAWVKQVVCAAAVAESERQATVMGTQVAVLSTNSPQPNISPLTNNKLYGSNIHSVLRKSRGTQTLTRGLRTSQTAPTNAPSVHLYKLRNTPLSEFDDQRTSTARGEIILC